MKKTLLFLLTIALSACGGISQITSEDAAMTARRLPNINPRGGQLCIFRSSNVVGMAMTYEIYADDEYIGRLPNDTYFCINLEPGEYVISTGGSWQRAGAETIISRGKRKFMELYVGMNGVSINSVTPEVGLAGIYDTIK